MSHQPDGSQSADDVVRRVRVRLIAAHERTQWDALMRTHHYLGFEGFIGPSLRYVAEWEGGWLALLGWQAAALKCRCRDRWIGWPPPLQYARLHLIANNSRFLILPESHRPNLASRVLSLNLKRLGSDWQAVHGCPLLLAETFVDPQRFTGACYRAANWRVLGSTQGFAKQRQTYRQHGHPKWVLIYPLHRRAQSLLADPHWQPRRTHMNPKALSTQSMERLRQLLKSLPDHRRPRGIRHRYHTVLTIALAGVLCGAKSFVALAEFAAALTQKQLKRLGAHYHRQQQRFLAPSEPTLRRVLQACNAELLDQALGQWLLAQASGNDALAVDGKTMRGARRPDGSQVHLLSAFLHRQALTTAQIEVDKKTNEIPEIIRLLTPLEIAGTVVTADAMHTQTNTAHFLVEEKQADYLLTVKDNQAGLRQDIATLAPSDFSPCVRDRR